jgi:hypothetical protein
MAGCFFRIFRHQGLEFGLGALMVDERGASCAEDRSPSQVLFGRRS